MNDRKQKLLEKHAKELEIFDKLQDIDCELDKTFMGSPIKITEHTCYADAFVTYNAASIHDALVFAEKCNPISVFRVKDSCLAFKPEASITEKDEERAKIDCVGPWTLEAKTMRQYGTEWSLRFFIKVKKYTLEVRVSIDDHTMRSDGYRIQYNYKHPSEYYPDGRVESCNIIYPRDHFTETDRFWATEGQPNNYVLY